MKWNDILAIPKRNDMARANSTVVVLVYYFSQLVHNFFTIFSQLVHDLFTTCSQLVHNLFTTCSWLVHDLHMSCSWLIFFMTCSWLVPGLVMACSWLSILNLFMNCSWFVHDSLAWYTGLNARTQSCCVICGYGLPLGSLKVSTGPSLRKRALVCVEPKPATQYFETTCSWLVYDFFTACLWFVHDLFILFHNMSMSYSQLVHDRR